MSRGRLQDDVIYLDAEHPLVAIAYERWRDMPWVLVLQEMSMLVHLSVKLADVRALDKRRRKRAAAPPSVAPEPRQE